MKTNRQLVLVLSIISGLSLPAVAGQSYNGGKMSADLPSAATAANNGLERANKIIGMEVTDLQDRKLGKVKDLAIDLEAGRIAEVIVGTGGFVGVDEKMIAVPPEALTPDYSGKQLRLADTKTFETAPFFWLTEWSQAQATSSARVADVYQRFHVPSYGQVTYLERANDIIGLTARNLQQQHLGKVETMVVDLPAGRIVDVILSTGGILGIKSELSALPPQAFIFDPNKDMLTLDRTKESLENSPHFKADDWRYGVDHPAI